MTQITQKQLIESLKQLKEIKPRAEWAVLLKSTLLENKVPGRMTGAVPARLVGIMDVISSLFFQRKLAYSFAVMLFLVIGVFGFASYTVPGDLLFPMKKIAEYSQAALAGKTMLKYGVATLDSRINDLAQVARAGRTDSIPSAINEVNENAKDLVKNLKDNPAKDSQTIKDIAKSLKTLASVPGADLSGNSDVVDLYQTIVKSQIEDLQKSTLTDDQKVVLIEVEVLYEQGKYADALEKILLISQ